MPLDQGVTRVSPILGAFVFRLTAAAAAAAAGPIWLPTQRSRSTNERPGDWETAESRSQNVAIANRIGSVELIWEEPS